MKKIVFVLGTLAVAACGTNLDQSNLATQRDTKSQAKKEKIAKIPGLVGQDRQGRLEFYGIDRKEQTIAIRVPVVDGFFTQTDIKKMMDCSVKRQTHAITVEVHKSKQTGVPTGIPGVTIETHMPKYKNIRCEKMPGFLAEWRLVVNGQ